LTNLFINLQQTAIVALDILLIILYRVWIKVYIFPKNEVAIIFAGEGKEIIFTKSKNFKLNREFLCTAETIRL
jgi:hypothetical protein